MSQSFVIRDAMPEDVSAILGFIRELAEYEKLSHEAVASEADIHTALFGERPVAEAILGIEDIEPVGFALYFYNFSTFVGKPGLYLEDLFVSPAYRGKGYGKALLVHLAQRAVVRGCGRFEWSVLDWNEPSIRFYESLGARAMSDWTVYRVDGDALTSLAAIKTGA